MDTLHNQIVVPVAAIQRGASGTFVYVVNPDHTVSMRAVTLGQTNEDRVAIAQGVMAGDTVVVDGADRLRDGAKVILPGEPLPNVDQSAAAGRGGAAPGRGGRGRGGAVAPAGRAALAAPVQAAVDRLLPRSRAQAKRMAARPLVAAGPGAAAEDVVAAAQQARRLERELRGPAPVRGAGPGGG